ncbi:Peroxidase 1 [Hordeum vulgare]|nr:Peroxidase 1 [Hordeum vulgare]
MADGLYRTMCSDGLCISLLLKEICRRNGSTERWFDLSYRYLLAGGARPEGRRTSRARNCGELLLLYGNIMVEEFAAKGLDVKDLVSRAHTWECTLLILCRLSLEWHIRITDPILNGRYADRLRMRCHGPGDSSATAEIDTSSCGTFDTSYYRQVSRKHGLLRSDVGLMDHPFRL